MPAIILADTGGKPPPNFCTTDHRNALLHQIPAHDYLERDTTVDSGLVSNLVVRELEKIRTGGHTPAAQPASSALNDIDARQ
jgi:hypothetical protein